VRAQARCRADDDATEPPRQLGQRAGSRGKKPRGSAAPASSEASAREKLDTRPRRTGLRPAQCRATAPPLRIRGRVGLISYWRQGRCRGEIQRLVEVGTSSPVKRGSNGRASHSGSRQRHAATTRCRRCAVEPRIVHSTSAVGGPAARRTDQSQPSALAQRNPARVFSGACAARRDAMTAPVW